MKNLFLSVILITLTGCAGIPSFYDDNESLLASNVVMSVKSVDCEQDTITFSSVGKTTNYLKTYSELKGSDDIVNLITIFEKSLNPVLEKENISKSYCKLKKETLTKQSSKMAEAIMGRY